MSTIGTDTGQQTQDVAPSYDELVDQVVRAMFDAPDVLLDYLDRNHPVLAEEMRENRRRRARAVLKTVRAALAKGERA